MAHYKNFIIIVMAMISLLLSVNQGRADTASPTVVGTLIQSTTENVINTFPTDKAFGDVIKENRHYPFINVNLMKEQKIIDHHFFQKDHHTVVLLNQLSSRNTTAFTRFVNQYSPYSDINLINVQGKSIGCLRVNDYYRLLGLGNSMGY